MKAKANPKEVILLQTIQSFLSLIGIYSVDDDTRWHKILRNKSLVLFLAFSLITIICSSIESARKAYHQDLATFLISSMQAIGLSSTLITLICLNIYSIEVVQIFEQIQTFSNTSNFNIWKAIGQNSKRIIFLLIQRQIIWNIDICKCQMRKDCHFFDKKAQHCRFDFLCIDKLTKSYILLDIWSTE